MAILRLPVIAQTTQHPANKIAAEIRERAGSRKQQKARVARHEVQPSILLRRLPADEAVPRTTLQRSRLPARQANPQRPQNRNIPQTTSHKAQESQPVMLAHQPVPPNALLRQGEPDLHIRYRGALRQSIHALPLADGKRDVQSSSNKDRINTQRK